ncbi:MAG TPA: galactokinase family protein, partial [Bryobacteraceae bacterium]|nr:galactokinase family protein [Bryobacteraceae bacterium]
MTGKRRFVGRAPGRLDLMGGDGSYTGGLVLGATTAESTWATVELREDRQILFFNPQVRDIGWEDEVEYSLDDLSSDERVRQVGEAPAIRWTAYILGTLFLLKQW